MSIQMLKNQRLQGIMKPSSVGCGSDTEVVIGTMYPPGSVVVMGGSVVDGSVDEGSSVDSPMEDVGSVEGG